MTAIVATKLKDKTNAIFVGEETGGSSYASRGMATGRMVLPNSKFRIQFNVYQLKYGIGEDTGRGVLPDFEVNYTIADRLVKKDLEIEKIRELINKK
jgi:C-terminal processing protease CtpA/Prc